MVVSTPCFSSRTHTTPLPQIMEDSSSLPPATTMEVAPPAPAPSPKECEKQPVDIAEESGPPVSSPPTCPEHPFTLRDEDTQEDVNE